MSGIAVILGIDAEDSPTLREARASWPFWLELEPDLRVVEDLAELPAWTNRHDARTNDVLRALACLGSPSGHDIKLATSVLCWLLLPGAITLAKQYANVGRSQIDLLVATELWSAARSVDWQGSAAIASSVLRRTRRGVQAELGISEGGRRARGRLELISRPPDAREIANFVPDPSSPDPADELRSFLTAAAFDGAIDEEELRLLLTLAVITSRIEDDRGTGIRRCGRGGLMCREAKEKTAAVLGMSPRTVGRRASLCIERLSRYAASRLNSDLVA